MSARMRTNMRSMILFVLTISFAAALEAQGTAQPTPEKESFIIEPGTLNSGVKDAALRLIASTPSGFSNSSSKLPAVKFSAGVTLVPNSFDILNQNEAQCRVNVDEEALGTIEVSVQMFGVNGSTVLKTLRGTLGVAGSVSVEGSQARVGVENVRLVRVNVQEPQTAGNIVISGRIAGSVRIVAPTGTTFSETPTPSGTGATTSGAQLESSNTVFSFNIGNAGGADVTVKVTGIRYATATFSASGGVEGDLACEISGTALSNQAALVVNAFTAKSTIDGSNDAEETPTDANPGSSDDETDSSVLPSSINTGTPNRRDGDMERRERGNRDREGNRTGRSGGASSAPGGRNAGGARPGGVINNPQAPNQPQQGQPGQPAGAQPVPARPANSGGTGTGSAGPEEARPEPESGPATGVSKPPVELVVTPGLFFCDKDFKPVTAVVMDRIVAGEAGGRVWIRLRLAKDTNPDKVETVTVKLTVGGKVRELVLTETSADSGDYRCGKDGILLVTEENPDSNEPEAANIPPKPRATYR